MKTSRRIKKYYHKQVGRILSILSQKESNYTEDDFHAIRVRIKKIKALFDLLEHVVPGFKMKKYFKSFSILFEQAGKIRDREVLYHLLENYQTQAASDKFKAELLQSIVKDKRAFFELVKKPFLKKLRKTRTRIPGYLKNIRFAEATQYATELSSNIRKLLQKNKVTPLMVHDLRKRIKDLFYVQKMLESKNHQAIRTDKFQDLLGEWHDARLLSLAMGVFEHSGALHGKNKLAFHALQDKVADKNDRQLRSFIRRKTALVKMLEG